MIETGSQITVRLPIWFAKNNNCATEMTGEIVATTDRAVRFRGQVIIRQATRCLICARELTHPVSLLVGIGPVCAERIGISRSQYDSLSPDELIDLVGQRSIEVWIPRSILDDGSPAEHKDIDLDALETAFNRTTEAPQPAHHDMPDRVERVFRETFSAKMSGYEARESQIQMARKVAEGLATDQHVVCEAGTGTGKSFAVVVPAIQHAQRIGRPVIISTGTIALQEQYVQKDIPFLKTILGEPFTAVLAKGKGNYVCKLRFDREIQRTSLIGESDLIAWARETETGDIADFPDNPTEEWYQINADDTCVGRKCPFYDRCHYFEAKRRANEADIVICNHHLFFADMGVKMITNGYGGVLPAAGAVIFDEAHHIEGVARDMLGRHASSHKLRFWVREVRKLPVLIDPEQYDVLRDANDDLFESIRVRMEEERQSIPEIPASHVEDLENALKGVRGELSKQSSSLSDEDEERADKLIDQAKDYLGLIRVATGRVEDYDYDNLVLWAERQERAGAERVTIHSTPIDVADILRAHLFEVYPSVILTSATMSVAGRFDHIKGRLGVDRTLELNVDSPFDYRSNCLLYCPRPAALPDPKSPEFHERLAPVIEEILLKSDGRALVLFTSYRGMQIVYDQLADRLRWEVLKQGDAPRSRLVDQFKADRHSVLFATKTFWEGISIEGEALSAVIIDKLPFAVPTDPITKAIAEAVEAQGKSSFFEISLPEAVLAVKQGFGRLIRTKHDRGLVAILDKRIRTKTYGRAFLDSLPRARRIETLENVEAFLGVRQEGAA